MTVADGQASELEAAALGRLHDYLRRAPQRTEAEELIARDAFIAGFRYGGRYTLAQSAALADPRFRTALGVLAEFMSEGDT